MQASASSMLAIWICVGVPPHRFITRSAECAPTSGVRSAAYALSTISVCSFFFFFFRFFFLVPLAIVLRMLVGIVDAVHPVMHRAARWRVGALARPVY